MIGLKVATYAREVASGAEGEKFIYEESKWEQFDEALANNADAILIDFPEVVGDDYIELLINLSKIAKSGKMLKIAGESVTVKKAGEL